MRQSIKSILCQTLRELEVICVNDGSTDSSSQIIRQLQTEDSRIIILQQENQGAGAARNLGMKKARGKYIAFLDADDYYLDVDALHIMYETCETLQTAVCGSKRKTFRNGKIFDTEVFEHTDYTAKGNQIYWYKDIQCDYNYQSFLFSKSLLLDHNISFPNYRRFQDPPFFVRAMYEAEQFYIAETYLYCYRSVFPPKTFTSEKAIDLVKGLRDNMHFAIQRKLDKLFNTTLERLEYDFGNIIYQNILFGDTRLLEGLLEINKMAKEYRGNEKSIRPLRLIYEAVRKNIDGYENELINRIHRAEKIYLYGAGMLTNYFIQWLGKNGLNDKVRGIIVSDRTGNLEKIEEIPVIVLEKYRPVEHSLILVTAGVNFHRDIEKRMLQNNIKNYELIDVSFLIHHQTAL